MVEFDLYDERDLCFTDPQTRMGQQLSQNLIEMTMDDDCLTDEETMLGAKKMLEYDLKEAVRQYQMDKESVVNWPSS